MLFVTFLLSGIALFLVIYAYSVLLLKKQNGEITTEPIESAEPKEPFWNKFKRKKSEDNQGLVTEDSSMTVGGVTAKVSSIIDSVKPQAEEVLPKNNRVAPTLSKGVEEGVNPSADKVTANIQDNEKGVEPSKPDLERIEATQAVISAEAVMENSDFPAPLERLAEEYAAKETNNEQVSQDEIAQALSEQVHKTDQVDKAKLVEEDAQQDLLDGQSLYSEPEPELSDIKDVVEDTPEVSADVERPTSSQQELHTSKKEFKAGANAIEIVAKISSPEPVLRDKTLIVYRKYDYLFTRHIGIYGKNTLTQLWEDIEQADQEDQFDDIAVSLQLADKTGAMTRKESNTFSTLAIEMADDLNKKMEFSMDVDESVDKGRMLDELARKYDAMVVCNIIPKRRKGFRSTDIKSCTKDLQMLPAKNGVFGRFAKVGEHSSLRYSLALADTDGEYIPASTRDPFQVDEIVVFMNVPLVKMPTEAFDSMIKDARKLAAWMDGKIVDKHARNMTSRTLDKIAEQIATIEKEMSLDGLVPGSEICKKLF